MSVTARVQIANRTATDSCAALITLYQAMQAGWDPPEVLDQPQWERLRATQDPADPLTAFSGFGCSFGGQWFTSYAKRYKYTKRWVTAAEAARSSLLKKLSRCRDVAFRACDYRETEPAGLIYCDPPYRGTLGYGAVEPWDAPAFWGWAERASQTALVAVSEQQAPEGWAPLLTFSLQHRIATAGGERRQEYLFVPLAHIDRWVVE